MADRKEHWKDIFGYPCYQVSNFGRIRSSTRKWGGDKRVLRLNSVNSRGYRTTKLFANGKGCCRTVHSVVLEAFVCRRPPQMECNHRDGNKTNNILENLEWVTSGVNQQHAFKLGLKKPKRGEASGRAKLTNKDVRSIRTLKENYTYPQKKLAAFFEVSLPNIEAIVQRRTWQHI